MKILAASLHYGESAISATVKVSQDDPDSDVDVYRHLVTDDPPVRGFSPSNRDVRHLDAELDLSVSDVVVECSFHADSLRYGDAYERADSEFCFGTLTLSKPMALSTCTSVPTEEGLARAMKTDFVPYRDGTGSADGRRKRQAPAVLDKFYEREVGGDAADTVEDLLQAMSVAAKSSSDAAEDYNGDFLLAKALPICVRSNGELVDLEPVEILRLKPTEVAKAVTQAECDALKRANQDEDDVTTRDLDPANKTPDAAEQKEERDGKGGTEGTPRCWPIIVLVLATTMRLM